MGKRKRERERKGKRKRKRVGERGGERVRYVGSVSR